MPRFKSLFWSLFWPVLGLFVAALAAMSFAVPALVRANAEANAISAAEATVAQFKTLRGYYTKNVVAKALASGALRPGVEHRGDPAGIPLPATMIHDLSQELAKQGTVVNLYSAFPFPGRSNRTLDDFQRRAWSFLTSSPGQTFSESSETQGRSVVRVGIADRMVADACVNCHNAHPDTPKSDWQRGDVRGVLEVEADISEAIALGHRMSALLLGITVAILVAIFATMLIVYRKSIGHRLEKVIAALDDIAGGEGDLTKRLDVKGEHEIARIGKAFNLFSDRMRQSVIGLSEETASLMAVANELHVIAGQSQESILRQDQDTEQVATAVNEIAVTAQEIANSANNAAGETAVATEATQTGQQVTENSITATGQLTQDIRQAADALSELQAKSENIGGVLDVIRSIAEQTNLLALNAAIEAARAGEQGRGFAVVADEVRTLAGRTQESTQEIQEMTEQLQASTRSVVEAMQASRKRTESTLSLAGEVGDHLGNITASVGTIADMNAHIAHAAQEQGKAVEAVNRNINGISQMAQSTANGAQTLSDKATTVWEAAQRLERLVKQFRT